MEPGLRLTGRYRLDQRLDGGDPGEVWRAWDEALHRPVAVRLPGFGPAHGAGPDGAGPDGAGPDGTRQDEAGQDDASPGGEDPDGSGPDGGPGCGLRERVVQAVRITHPAFVTIYDCDRAEEADDGPVAFMVTALLKGESLARRLARGPLPVAEALDCCAQVAAALDAAHTAGVAHGSLLPEKIFLTPDGVRIVDLGIGTPGDGTPEERAEAVAGDMAAFGSLLTASLDGASPDDLTAMPEEVRRLCAQCLSAAPGDHARASMAAEILARAEVPVEPAAAPAPEPEPAALDATLVHEAHVPPEDQAPEGEPAPAGAGADLRGRAGPVFRVAVTVAVLAVALAVVLMLVDRGNRSGAFYRGDGTAPAPSPRSSSPATPGGRSPVPVPAVYDTLGRLQPIVDSGRASGAIRSDVAVDFNNSITNLRNDLAAGRTAEAARRLRELREKIATRLRERALDERVAAQMTEVLATTAP